MTTTQAQNEAKIAMDAATPNNPAFIVYKDSCAVRLATDAEIARFCAQHKHLCLCRPMALTDGEWMDTHNGYGVSNQPYMD